MSQVIKTKDGIFVPKELVADFEHVRVDASDPRRIIIESPVGRRGLDALLDSIDRQREDILRRRGLLGDSSSLVREDRDSR